MSVFFPPPALDDSPPSPERQQELRDEATKNRVAGQPPYDGVHIRTRGEWQWVMRENRWIGFASEQEHADFRGAVFNSANLSGVSFQLADLRGADLSFANLSRTWSSYADFSGAKLPSANLEDALLAGTNFNEATLSRAKLGRANLMIATLRKADLVLANLSGAFLANVDLRDANLQLASLKGARLEGVDLRGAVLCEAVMDAETRLHDAQLDSTTRLADVVWNGAPLTRLMWAQTPILGDEREALRERDTAGKAKDAVTRRAQYGDAVRANRQVANVLQAQGLNEEAARYAYRAQRLRRVILRREAFQRHSDRTAGASQRAGAFLAYAWSCFLDVIAGYGYQPWKAIVAYVAVITAFASAYFLWGPSQGVTFSPLGALVFSVTSFHGRGFFPGGSPGHAITLDDPLIVLAAGEAVLGLLIEVSFIATFTQRFFNAR